MSQQRSDNKFQTLAFGVASMIGFGFGAVAILFMHGPKANAARTDEADSSSYEVTNNISSNSVDLRISRLADRLKLLESADTPDKDTSANHATTETDRIKPSREERRNAREEVLSNFRARFQSEPVDSQWSQAAATAIEADVITMGHDGERFEAISVDCRSQLCAIEVEWPSRQEAINTASDLITHSYAYNCSRHYFLSETDEIPYRSTVFLDCPVATRTWPD